ncbi:hypothetical protein ACIQXA_32135 [Streptomyces massasporeus]|uniref:hypothetical protein n=1 Tax=Streptomyces massasporeus TaxID=67324 RepID=UPI00382EE1A1
MRDKERHQTKEAAKQAVGELSNRELFLAGAVLHRAEGAKDKAHSRQRRENLQFINSDPNVIRFYLRWLESLEVERERLRFRLHIHESADAREAEAYWADLAGVDAGTFQGTTLKKHTPRTVRKNVGASYRAAWPSTSPGAPTCIVAWKAPGTA